MRSSKLIIKSIAQKVMANYGFGCKFHDLKYLDFRFFFFIFLEFIINMRATLQFCRKHKFNVILSCFKKNLDNYMFNLSTCTLLALSSRICIFFLNLFCQHILHGFVDQCVFQSCMIFSFTKFKFSSIVLNHFHLNLRRVMEFCT